MVLIKSFLELSDDWRDFDPAEEDSLLPLESDILGPSDKPGEISFRLDVIANSVVPRPCLEQRMGFLLTLLDNSLLTSFSLNHNPHTIGDAY